MSKRILITTPSWIDGCVMTQSLYRRLHELYPGCTVDTLAPRWSMIVFEYMPKINRVTEDPFGHGTLELKKRWRIGCELGKEGYDQVIVLPGSLKSTIIALTTGIRQRIDCIGESRYFLLNDIRELDKAASPLMVDRYTALAYPTQADFNGHPDNPYFAIDPGSRQAALVKHSLTTDKPILALCSGVEYGPARRWPACHFTEPSRRYLAKDWQAWLFGLQKDFDVADEINRLSDGLCTNPCGKADLSEVIDLLFCADMTVYNDSGLMHLAAAPDRKLVAVYDSSSPGHAPPLSQKAKIVNLSSGCSPCFKRECPLEHADCLNKLTPDIVQEAAEELICSV